MTTDCSATMTPTNDGAAAGEAALDAVEGANRSAATTTARNAANLTAVVASWKRLLTRMPADWSATRPTSVAVATILMKPASEGARTAVNSPIAIDTYPSTAQYVTQSVQPTAKPTESPKARRAYT